MSQQTLLSAASIIAAKDIEEEIVEVPEWDGSVRLVQMNAEETTAFTRDLNTKPATGDDGMYLMLIHSARDAEGQRIFTMEDLPALRKKSINALNRLQMIALRLNKMDATGRAALKKV